MWKKTVAALLFGALSFVLLGMGFSGQNSGAAAYKKLSAQEAKAIMDSGEPYVLLDVRTEEEFQERHIKGAILIPYTEVISRAAAELPDKDAVVLIYCRSGRRSAIAANDLIKIGYTRVYDFGGINDWPYEIVTGASAAKQ
ncbi:rhodanese-like domain-containing protein [Desulfovibrio sp. OttesenSCG-928-F20]|nr:rhodanese-like domain-containing protein [Desulfovibrio sp. OttesenSCG-928-F20]